MLFGEGSLSSVAYFQPLSRSHVEQKMQGKRCKGCKCALLEAHFGVANKAPVDQFKPDLVEFSTGCPLPDEMKKTVFIFRFGR